MCYSIFLKNVLKHILDCDYGFQYKIYKETYLTLLYYILLSKCVRDLFFDSTRFSLKIKQNIFLSHMYWERQFIHLVVRLILAETAFVSYFENNLPKCLQVRKHQFS